MKRYIALVLCTVIILLSAGCNVTDVAPSGSTGVTTESTTAPGAEETSTPTGSAPAVQAPMVTVSLPAVTESAKANDGTEIFHYTYQNISLTMPDPDVAEKVIIDFLNRIDSTRENAESILALARSTYNASSNWNPYQCVVTYEPLRIDFGVLSMLGSHASFSGSSHPETVYEAVNYDLVTGKVLSLSDILDLKAHADTLCQQVIDSLDEQAEAKYLYADYEDIAKELFSSTAKLEGAWYLSTDGLCFYFSPRELAPYTSGVIAATIPYEALTGILSDAYFPAERDTATGTIMAEKFENATLTDYTQYAELILKEGSDNTLLYTDTNIYDIRIDCGTWSASGANFTRQYTAFAASGLTPGDAIMVSSPLSDTTPNLRIQYQTAEGTVTYYLVRNSNNDSVQLICA